MEQVIEDVKAERERQDERWGGPEHDDRHDVSDWCHFIQRQIMDVQYNDTKANDDETYDAVVRKNFIKIAALAVAAVESIDRHTGGTARPGGE